MDLNRIIIGILVGIGVWLVILSLSFYWIVFHYNRLAGGTKKVNLKRVLDKLLSEVRVNKKELLELRKGLDEVRDKSRLHIQKVGLARFNPFKDVGGDQSFSLAILDEEDSGMVITGLHARDRTRTYVKPVTRGRSKFQLSAEEKRAIKIAQKS